MGAGWPIAEARASVLGDLQLFLSNSRFDDLGPIDTPVVDGIQYEYVHLTRTGGRRVYMNNPDFEGGSPHAELVRRMRALAED